jgi:peptidoglycan/LPS O-acetylase OafA/YrhL
VTLERPSPPADRIADLDALRGLAALAVVLFHYTTRYGELYGHEGALPFAVPWGHFGVQLFFGISGFVIFMTLERTRTLADFAVSRFSRLYPAYWAAMLLTGATVFVAGMNELALSPSAFAANATMLQSFASLPSVDGVYWTLSVELAFYVAMALLWRLRLLGRIEPLLLFWMSLHWVWRFAPDLLGIEPSWLLGAVLLQQHIPFFAIGIAAYRLRAGADRRWPAAVIAAALATVAACDGLVEVEVAAITAATLLAVALLGLPPLRFAPFVWLGAISYSLYLLHQYIGFALLGRSEAAGLSPGPAILVTLAAILLIASAVTLTVERPALNAIRRRWRARRVPAPPEALIAAE